ncbi:hypothetical protein AVEN_147436-1 [Araneus ventricosus]|uniref:Uncharacterized protein n=1 Tax=Araneus ventricosus TaxID=182803 RepID=A0A4Y2DQ62_ARAVE|nr:hypothetical protein AVEN_147436-1 [Araneus ventricosus]
MELYYLGQRFPTCGTRTHGGAQRTSSCEKLPMLKIRKKKAKGNLVNDWYLVLTSPGCLRKSCSITMCHCMIFVSVPLIMFIRNNPGSSQNFLKARLNAGIINRLIGMHSEERMLI